MPPEVLGLQAWRGTTCLTALADTVAVVVTACDCCGFWSRAQLRHSRRQIPQRWRQWHWLCAVVVIAVRLFASLFVFCLCCCCRYTMPSQAFVRPSTAQTHITQLDICLNTVNTHKANRKSPHTADRRVGDSFDWFMAASECSSKWERQHSNGIRWQFRDINLSNRLTGASSDLDLELVLSCLLCLLDYYSIATFIGRIHRSCNIAMKSASGFVVPNKMCF